MGLVIVGDHDPAPDPWTKDAAEIHERLNNLKIAIIHDQLYTLGGAEQVLMYICKLFPEASVYSLFNTLDKDAVVQIMGDRTPKVTFLQKLPMLKRLRKTYFPLMPLAIEQLDVSGYDIVISSSYMVAKGVIVTPEQSHICYLHSPMRYAWDQQTVYVRQISRRFTFRRMIAKMILHYMRIWDARSANGVDRFLANSSYVSRRALKAYRRDAVVLYPPVDVARWRQAGPRARDPRCFVTMSRLVEGKRVDLILDAFRLLPDCRLHVIGGGAMRPSLEAAAPPNVRFLGRLGDAEAREEIASASAFIYAAEEDFGIAPVEAQACGTPVVAFGRGGTAETVRDFVLDPDGATGVLYAKQSPEAIAGATRLLQRNRSLFSADACQANAERFSVKRFEIGLLTEIAAAMDGDGSPLAPRGRREQTAPENNGPPPLVRSLPVKASALAGVAQPEATI